MNNNNCSQAIRRYLLTEAELTSEELDAMTPNEVFKEVLNYEGLLFYAEKIKKLVEGIYGIDLNRYWEYVDEESMAGYW